MIGGVTREARRVRVTLALPFPNAPIEDELVRLIHEAVEPLAAEVDVEVETIVMDEERRRDFLEHARPQRRAPSSINVKHVLAVLSGKGGVGKSSVAGLLAGALQRRGLKAGVLDADITGPSIPKLFGVSQRPGGSPEGILPPETGTGIKLISINLMLQSEDEPVIWRGPMVGKAIEQFWQSVAWGELDYLIVDLPPGTSDAPLTVMQSLPVDGIILVTSPQDLAGMVVRKAANMARQLAVPLLGLVENMSYVECPECGARIEPFGPSRAEDTARHAGVGLLGRIPLDPRLAVMCDEGRIEEYQEMDFAAVVDEVLELTFEDTKRG
jgi:Mrp family chromosome partitioning ATPase